MNTFNFHMKIKSSSSKMIRGVDWFGIVSYQCSKSSPGPYGLSGQCVEFARRWLSTVKYSSFESVDSAVDIWKLTHATRLGKKVAFQSISVHQVPQLGDLAIYDRHPGSPYGHVAVVIGVYNRSVFLSEQNWSDKKWTGYARCEHMDQFHSYLIGWKRIH